MLKMANDETLRKNLIAKGNQQKQKFSWDLTAERLYDCVIRAVKNPDT
jgi:hypothetical protein